MNGAQVTRWERAVLRAMPGAGGCRVVAELARCGRRFDKITPSVVGIADRAHVGTATVKRATAAAVAAGYLTVVRRKAHCRSDGTWSRSQTNLYVPRWPSGPRKPWSHRGITRDPSMPATPGSSTPPGAAVVDNEPDPPPEPPPDAVAVAAGTDVRRIWQTARDAERARRGL